MPGAGAYLRTVFVVLAVAAGLLVAFCALVDPYGIIGSPALAGVNARKLAAADRQRMTKPYRIEQLHPATIVTGSSSANVGFDPSDPAWPARARPVFNLGIDGALPEVQLRFLQHALATGLPRVVVLPLTFEDMMLAPRRTSSEAVSDYIAFEPRLRVLADGGPNPRYALARLRDVAFATFSATAIYDSVLTIALQSDPEQGQQSAGGFDDRVRFASWIEREGLLVVLRQSMVQRLNELRNTEAEMSREMAALGTMVRVSRRAGAEVVVLVTPTYRAGLELRRRLGLSEASQAWLADLARTVEGAAAGTGGPEHVTIWNFEGYRSPVQEPLPPDGTRAPLRWFWETVHFRPELGGMMIARALDGTGPDGFGERLTVANAAAQAARYHRDEAAWVAANPAESTRMRDLAVAAIGNACQRRPGMCKTPIELLP